MMRMGYCDGPDGQIHYRQIGEQVSDTPPLICLHPAPFSGLAFSAIMPHLAQGRMVIAPDFPGHGGSHAFRSDPAIADYAKAMLSVVEQVCSDGPVDLLGFHTGCLVASEMALMRADALRHIVLLDVPAFDPETRAAYLASAAAPPGFTADIASLEPAWDRGITRRIESQGMERSFEMFVEQLRHGERMNAGFHAGFTYPIEERLSALTHATTVIASQSMLLGASRRAADLIPDAKLVERLDITRAVLDEAAPEMAGAVLAELDS